MDKKTYEVITGREGAWWWIEVPDVKFGFSQAATYDQLGPMAREAIALCLDVPEDSFDIAIAENS